MLPQPAIRASIRTDGFRRPASPASSQVADRGSDRDPLAQSMQLMGAVMSFPRNTEIFGENEPADYVYKVISGSVRTYNILNDGRRQVGGFYLPGDIFGLEFTDEHSFSAEAISDAKVVVIKRSALTALAGRDATIGRELFALTGRELRRVQDRVLLLVRARRSASPASCWRWRSARRPAISSSFRCRARTLPTISA
jgi:CRP-like cAMP-binding protein